MPTTETLDFPQFFNAQRSCYILKIFFNQNMATINLNFWSITSYLKLLYPKAFSRKFFKTRGTTITPAPSWCPLKNQVSQMVSQQACSFVFDSCRQNCCQLLLSDQIRLFGLRRQTMKKSILRCSLPLTICKISF